MLMKKICLLFTAMAMLLSGAVASAQTKEVTGVITDASNGEPIPFASVRLKDAMTGASAGSDGKYSINIPSGKTDAVLVFSFVGYVTTEIPVDGKSVVNCNLKVDSETLENAVVVGYGSAKKIGSLVGSVTTVNSETIKNAPSSSALDQLQGQVAGLAVMTTGGIAGEANVSMTLHGVGSLGSSTTPLYIVDGVPVSSRTIMAMNPNDIKSISILKDASATSIYGSRAANGVVYVTTKTGSYDSKSTVTVRSQAGISTLADKSLYRNMMSGDELKEFWVRAGIYTPDYIKAAYTDRGYDANTKWYNVFQQFNNPQFQNDVTVEGGSSKVSYMVGASQFHQRGSTIGNYYDRYTVRTNVQAHPKEWFKIGANVSLTYDTNQKNGNWGGASSVSQYTSGGLSFLLNPLFPSIDPETGELYETKFPSGMTNPHYYMSKLPAVTDRYGLLGSVNVEIEPVRNLKINSRMGLDGHISMGTSTRYPSYIGAPNNGARSRSDALEYAATITNTIEYSFDIHNDHKISILAGHEGIANYYDYNYGYAAGITDDRLTNLQNGTAATRSVEESHTESKFLSFFGHVDYTLFDRYIADVTVRNDACSRFGVDNRNATFWSAGILWKMKKESFLKNVKWLNDLNFKVSYGTQGNASIGDYSSLALIGTTTNYADGISNIIAQPANPALTWEKQGLLTVSLSGRLADRVDLGVEFYNRKTTSMLLDVPYNYTTGFSSLTANVGTLQNTGVDITLGVDILRNRDYWLRFSTTFNYNSEKVTSLFNGLDRWEMVGYGFAYVKGQSVNFYAPIFAGIDPADGLPMWYVAGDDPDVTTKKETTKVYDEAALTQNTGKKLNPPIYGGFSIGGGWKGLSIQADFSYVLGKTLVNNDAYFYANPVNFAGMNTNKSVADFWTPENTDAKWPDWSKGVVMDFDTHLYENANFLRLKSLQAAYALPKKALGKQNVLNGLKITFTGRNLLTATKYTGIDPEVDSNLTYGRAGNTKQYLFGLEFTF